MQINILTIFPEAVEGYFQSSIMKRAQQQNVLTLTTYDIRSYSTSKHGNVDDTPYGGGAGMVMQVEPIHRAIKNIKTKDKKTHVILLSAKGKRYTQRDADRLSAYDSLTFICGRYEGIDERVAQHIADEEISLGDFVLTGGELGAMTISDSIVRLLPEVLGNSQSAVHESHKEPGYTEHPHYTKPETYNGWSVPSELLSGDHGAIEKWRKKNSNKKM